METAILVFAGIGAVAILAAVISVVHTLMTAIRDIERLERRCEYIQERQDDQRNEIYKLDDRIENIEDLIAKQAVKTLKK
jgi:prefoldin subunit 5